MGIFETHFRLWSACSSPLGLKRIEFQITILQAKIRTSITLNIKASLNILVFGSLLRRESSIYDWTKYIFIEISQVQIESRHRFTDAVD